MTKTFLIIDGSSILFRSYYALPHMNTTDGKTTNAILGFLNILFNGLEMIKPDGVCVCFDLPGGSFRNEMYDGYKSNREKAPEDLSEQFIYIKEILDSLGIAYIEKPGYEADDLAGTLSKILSSDNKTYLLSGDKDYLQLVNENTRLLFTVKGISELNIFDRDKVKEKYDIYPEQVVDLKALMGDPSDNIPGVPGVGKKRATSLINEYENLDNIYANIDSMKKSKVKESLLNNKEIAYLSRELAKINLEVELDENITEKISYDSNFKDSTYEILKKYELNSIIRRLNLESENIEETKVISENSYNIIEDESSKNIIAEIKKNKSFIFKTLNDGKPYRDEKAIYMGILVENDLYLVNLSENSLSDFKEVFEDEKISKIGYGLKDDILNLIGEGIEIKNYTFDSMIAEYLINPLDNNYSISNLRKRYNLDFENRFSEIESDKKLKYENLNSEDLNLYLKTVLTTVKEVKDIQIQKLKELNLTKLYTEIEIPLIEVLADIEYTGVYIDAEELESIGKDLDLELEKLTSEIYRLSGEEFNINSPKQLGNILFDKLKLPVIKKTKTGYSTNIDVLERLEPKHEIISYIIKYRTISKLISTYVNGLRDEINPKTKRIHSSFNQTVASTGRLSSVEPNLQNIPVRTEEGRQFRKIFKAEDKNYKLIDGDYSQIELRILADIANDKNMIQAFLNNEDIHRSTAAKVFKVDFDKVTPLMRSRAKAVNFGIVYGISDFGLSEDLKISKKEAKNYIDSYLSHYKGIEDYMKEIVKKAKEDGYVESKFHRRRDLPELKSRNNNIRKFGERIALNMPIQGTAADIIKIAMINVYRKLKKNNLKSKLILQVHDELIIESPSEEVSEVEEILKLEMQNAVKLKMPLKVDVNIGDSWYETK